MAVSVPSWFDLNYYLAQKATQMNNIQCDQEWLQERGADKWDASLASAYMQGWPWGKPGQIPLEGGTLREKAYSNFCACNEEEYTIKIGAAAINVSGTPLFDVEVYLQNLADFHNSQNGAKAAQATIQTELQALIAAKTSAWGYFQQHWQEMPQVNPSNNFDLSAYIAARAAQAGTTVAQVMAEIQANGENPITDFSVWGPAHGMDEAPKPTKATEPRLPDGWSIWGPIQEPDAPNPPTPSRPVPPSGGDGGGSGGNEPAPEPKPVDPYDENVKTVDMSAGEGSYEGQNGQNTRFEATLEAGKATLKATDVITGGEDALNTLAVALGENWAGFEGVKGEDGATQPNVTNVGRIQLSHAGGDDLTFSAKNISDDAVRYDLDSKDSAKTISLSDLGQAVEEVRISNVAASGETPETTVAFAENKAPKDLTLVLDNVSPTVVNKIETGAEAQALADAGADSTVKSDALNLKIAGVENLTVQAEGSASAQADLADYTSERMAGISVDLSETDAKTLTVKGSGDIAFWGLDGSRISSMDASAASGNVTFGVKNLTDQTVIKGGSGRDMISFDVDAANVGKANWTGIEDVLMRHGGTIDASGVVGLRELWNLSNGETCEIRNLKADDFYVCGAPTWGENIYQHVIVNGDIGNLTWTSAERGVGEQYFSTLDSNAKGDFHLNVGYKDILASDTGDGRHFSSYRLPELQGAISVDIANPTPGGAGMHIAAPKAASLEINAAGSLMLGGDTDLAAVETVAVNLKSEVGADDQSDRFYLGDHNQSDASLQSVREIDITASDGRHIASLGNIGGEQNEGISLNARNIMSFHLESARVSEQGSLTLGLDNGHEAQIGALIAGNVDVNVSGCSGSVQINDIQAAQGVSYIGGDGQPENEDGDYGDVLTVTRLGNGSSSDFQLGGGDDILKIDVKDSMQASDSATVDVELGDGKDFLGVAAHSGLLRVNVSDYTADDEMSVMQSGLTLDKATAQEYLGKFGIKAAAEDIVLFDVAVAENPDSTAVQYANDVYLFNPQDNDGLTMVVLAGLTAEDADMIHLR